jgi:hypothetical protein
MVSVTPLFPRVIVTSSIASLTCIVGSFAADSVASPYYCFSAGTADSDAGPGPWPRSATADRFVVLEHRLDPTNPPQQPPDPSAAVTSSVRSDWFTCYAPGGDQLYLPLPSVLLTALHSATTNPQLN